MNWLAKINLPVVAKRLGAFKSALLLFSTIALCLFVGYRIGNYFHSFQTQTISQQKLRLDELYHQQNENLKHIHTLELELEVERIANQRAQQTIKAMEVDHFAVKKQLAFYEKVMAPEKQADGLVIDQVALEPTESENHYRFSVVLIQQTLKKRYAKGYIEFSLKGSQANRPATLKLEQISQLSKEQRSFSLKYFQRIEGDLTVPADFIPESLEIKAVLPKGKWQKYSELNESYPWSALVKPT
ncbi:DUF6776 family protein [Thalassotalea euphylliae]|uniref:Uncharacterized protein n=1 Tax=Thalassotalea euphylliae TaxID=1655234 RepID=A0A3E0U3Z7_9GAMM|nr:DUF6776 family protein [Thalassotalea euphylliae]REL31711.1 hypothetical protein DXX94_13865 [Thalassotalea euphylliae]